MITNKDFKDLCRKLGVDYYEVVFPDSKSFREIITLIKDGAISHNSAKQVMWEIMENRAKQFVELLLTYSYRHGGKNKCQKKHN